MRVMRSRGAGTDRDALKAQFEAHVNAKSEAAAQVPRLLSHVRARSLSRSLSLSAAEELRRRCLVHSG